MIQRVLLTEKKITPPPAMRPAMRLLWLDFNMGVQPAELPVGMHDRAVVSYHKVTNTTPSSAVEITSNIDVIVADFDYPDRNSLRLLRQIKNDAPSTPIIMLTLKHSEALAVWAFRSRVWDYLVKPVPNTEVTRCFDGLANLFENKDMQSSRHICMPKDFIPGEVAETSRRSESQRLLPAINYIEQNYASKIRLDQVAPLCQMGSFKFSRLFKETYGVGFREYVLQFRMREACKLLESPDAMITNICFSVGFNDGSYFTRKFRQYFGVAPSEVAGEVSKIDISRLSSLLPNGRSAQIQVPGH